MDVEKHINLLHKIIINFPLAICLEVVWMVTKKKHKTVMSFDLNISVGRWTSLCCRILMHMREIIALCNFDMKS